MRLNVSFIVLLLVATTASTLAWREVLAARAGVGVGWAAVVTEAALAFVAVVLLARIVLRVYALRRGIVSQPAPVGASAPSPAEPGRTASRTLETRGVEV